MKFATDKQKEYLDYAIEIYKKLKGEINPSKDDIGTVGSFLPTVNYRLPGKNYGTLWD
jgi:hypothetical protein